jgi:hypothetical protein
MNPESTTIPGKTQQSRPKLVAAAVTPNPTHWKNRGVHLTVREGTHAGKIISLPDDGHKMSVVPYEFCFLIESALTLREGTKGRKLLMGDPIASRSFGFAIDTGRNRAYEALQQEIAQYVARPAGHSRPALGRPTSRIAIARYPFLEKGRYDLRAFATFIAQGTSDEHREEFAQQVGNAPDMGVIDASLGSLVAIGGQFNSAVLLGPCALVESATKTMFDNPDESWRLISVAKSPDGDRWGLTLTTVPEDKWEFDAESILKSMEEAHKAPKPAPATPQPQAASPKPAPKPAPKPVVKSTPAGTKPKVPEVEVGMGVSLAAALSTVPVLNQDTPEPEEAPATEVEEAPATETEEAPAPEVEEAPATETEEAPAPEVEEAPATETEEAPAPEVEEAPTQQLVPADTEPTAETMSQAQTIVMAMDDDTRKALEFYIKAQDDQREMIRSLMSQEKADAVDLYLSAELDEQRAIRLSLGLE